MELSLRESIYIEGNDLVHLSHLAIPLHRSDLHQLTLVVHVDGFALSSRRARILLSIVLDCSSGLVRRARSFRAIVHFHFF